MSSPPSCTRPWTRPCATGPGNWWPSSAPPSLFTITSEASSLFKDAVPNMKEQWPFVVVFLLAWIGTDLLIPWVRRLAFHFGKTDAPGERKVHTEPIPRLGGIAIFAGFCLGLIGVEV